MVSGQRRGRAAASAEIGPAWSRRALLRGAGSLMLGGAAAALTRCGHASPSPAPAMTVAALAERYVRLTLRLAKQQPSLVEVWLGPPSWTDGPRLPAPTLRAETRELREDLDRVVATSAQPSAGSAPSAGRRDASRAIAPNWDGARLAYLAGQIRALDEAAGRLLGESRTFAEDARRSFGHAAPPRDAAALDALRQRLSELLPGQGTLAERHAAFRRSLAVPPDRVEAVFAAAVAWCRTAAREVLPLPAGDTLTTRAADDTGWAAFSRPTGARASELWVSRRGGADPAHLLQLAAHEATPGHHAQHVLAMAELVEARGWTERALTPAFGPHRLLAEGAAEAGADLLLPLPTRERICGELLLPAAGLPPAHASRLAAAERLAADLGLEVAYIASDYLDSSLGTEVVTARLRDDALVLDPAGMVAFIEKQRSRVLAYPLGRQLVHQALTGTTADDRWTRFKTLSTTLTFGRIMTAA